MKDAEIKFLERAAKFLKEWDIDCDGDILQLTDRDNSIIANPDADFSGHSIRAVAEAFARLTNKKIQYKQL